MSVSRLAAVSKAGYTLRSETAPVEKTASLKENLPLITLIIMMALSWGLERINHPFGNLAFIAYAGRTVSDCPPGITSDEKRLTGSPSKR